MRFTPRLFMAAAALVSTTAFVQAQDGAAPKPAPASAASVAIVETAANPAPPNVAANTAQAKGLVPESPNETGTRGWILLGLVVVALFTSITRYRRRLPKGYPITRVANLPLDPVPAPVPARLS